MFSFKAFAALALSSLLVSCNSNSIASFTPIPDTFAFTPSPAILAIAKESPSNYFPENPWKIQTKKGTACKELKAGLKFIRSGNKLFIRSEPWNNSIVFTKVQHYQNAVECFETDKITFHDIISGRKLTIPKI